MLRRYWFEFDLRGHAPERPGQVGGGSTQYAWLSRGAGVTGVDQSDCLGLLRDLVDEELPPVAREIADVDFATFAPSVDWEHLGNPAWRGVWWPPANVRGPDRGETPS